MKYLWPVFSLCLSSNVIASEDIASQCSAQQLVAPKELSDRSLGKRFGGVNAKETVTRSESLLRISPVLKEGEVLGGMVSTSRVLVFNQGILSMDAYACLADGFRAALWLQSKTNEKYATLQDKDISTGAEFDIIELIRKGDKFAYSAQNVHWNGYEAQHETMGEHTAIPKPCQWHNYVLVLSERDAKFYIDGEHTWTVTNPHPPNQQYLILSVEVPKRARKNLLSTTESLGVFEVKNIQYCPTFNRRFSPQSP